MSRSSATMASCCVASQAVISDSDMMSSLHNLAVMMKQREEEENGDEGNLTTARRRCLRRNQAQTIVRPGLSSRDPPDGGPRPRFCQPAARRPSLAFFGLNASPIIFC